jgi:hypothetical protein
MNVSGIGTHKTKGDTSSNRELPLTFERKVYCQ